MYTAAAVNDKFFTDNKFTIESPGVYMKTEYRQIINYKEQQRELLERVVRFKVYDVHPELGTNIEFYIGKWLQVAGYWTDLKDFRQTFSL